MGDEIKLAAAGLCLVLTAAAAPVPKVVPGKLETYRDWTIGCDNVGACAAASLMPENDPPDGTLFMRIEREAGPAAELVIWLQIDDDKATGPANFLVDGRKLASAPLSKAGAKVAGPQAAALAMGMARGRKLEVRLGTKLLGTPSLAGSAAALRYMDAMQGRAGTTTALIAVGALGPQAVKPAPAMPVVHALLPPAGLKAAELWADEKTRAVKIAGCIEDYDPKQSIDVQPLSRSQTLVLVPCGAGAYNFMSVPLIATGAAGRRVFVKAKFDFAPGFGAADGGTTLVNADWDAKTGKLSSFAKGRGLGDCGNSEDYVWDGAMFRLVEATAMTECRGVSDWITIWRVKAQ